jgi:hypothetical protein
MAGPAQQQELLLKVAAEACQRLFGHYGYPLRTGNRDELHTTALSLHGLIGFSGKSIRGNLVLASSAEPLERSNPARTVAVRDWMGELTNQLLGRIKNQLLLYKVELKVSTPLILRESHMADLAARKVPSAALRGGSAGLVRVWMDVTLSPGFQMSDHPDPSLAGPTESETLFF